MTKRENHEVKPDCPCKSPVVELLDSYHREQIRLLQEEITMLRRTLVLILDLLEMSGIQPMQKNQAIALPTHVQEN